jgi:mycothione reductase
MPRERWLRWSSRDCLRIVATDLSRLERAAREAAEHNSREFDLVVIGAGSGNSLIGPEVAGWSVALIDDGERFGGTCLNAGCIPTKMFVRVADVAADAAEAGKLGLSATIDPVDWPLIRDRVFAKTDKISNAGFRYRDVKSPNVTVFRESFSFEDQHTLVSNSGVRIHGNIVVVAAGSRPRALSAPYTPDPAIHDSDSIMRIESLPESLVILGGGAVAVEFAHVFASFGVDVTVVVRGEKLLSTLDGDVSDLFTRLASDKWRVVTNEVVESIDRDGEQLVTVLGSGRTLSSQLVLIAQGRVPNTDTIGAARAGFDLEPDGRLSVDGYQRVLSGGEVVPTVFALGDVSSPWQLKHVANHEARLVAHNIVHPDSLIGGNPGPVPAAVFSHPQIAHFGLTEEQATYTLPDPVIVSQEYRTTAYGWALEDVTSFCKLVVDRDSGQLLGAHIIGPEASILIQPLIQAASMRQSIRGLARSQYWPHPAASEVVENALLKAEEQL